MQPKSVKYEIGSEEQFERMRQWNVLDIFSDVVCDFLNDLSHSLIKSAECKKYSDVIAFAFWCRKGSLKEMAKKYDAFGDSLRIGRGLVFHVTPSNVPVNFAYSFVAALLAGNASVVRLPSKDFPQTKLIRDNLIETLKNHPRLQDAVCMVRYGHDKSANDFFSLICDSRIIWGGDRTINEIRKSPLKPRANEITFANRFSVAVINGDAYLEEESPQIVAKAFYDDTYLTDQNACSSPRIVVWIGENVKEAQKRFWSEFYDYVKAHYTLRDAQAVDKLTKLCLLQGITGAKQVLMPDNLITRIEIPNISSDIIDYLGNSGFFPEFYIKTLDDMLPFFESRCQTLSYYGFSKGELADFIKNNKPKGIDRIVPMGHTMDFALDWDGHDLIIELSRVVATI